MKAHAAAIAEKLQGAHERRQRHEQHGREDEDMGKDEDRSVWSPEKREVVDTLAESVYDALLKLAEKNAPGEPQSNAVTPERVVELERQLAEAIQQRDASDAAANERDGEHEELQQRLANMVERAETAERQRDERERWLQDASNLLQSAYVAREVGWSDVAAGMMTIARDGAAWMVAEESAGVFQLQSGTRAFAKTPKPGETVRVLVPYVTPEQAETAVREQLGGTAVS